MNQSKTTCQQSDQKAANQARVHPKHVQVRKPRWLRGPDGKVIGSMKRTQQEVEEDFWKRVKVGGMDECWEWQAGRNGPPPFNYGIVWINGTKRKTHSLSCELVRGPIPKGLCVCHHCDNPPCCNPLHLFVGTNLDNVHDMISKGRANRERGEERYNAHLTERDIREIRRRYKVRDKVNGCTALGKEFGVGLTMIYAIVTGRRWRHVT